MVVNKTAVALAAVIVIICVAGTLTTFGIGDLLDDEEEFPTYEVSGHTSDGSAITGMATCRDTGESGSRPVLEFEYSLASASDDPFTLRSYLFLEFEYSLASASDDPFTLRSYLFLDTDRLPIDSMFTNAGRSETSGVPTTMWVDSTGEYTYHIDSEGNVLAVDIRVDGLTATAVQATP